MANQEHLKILRQGVWAWNDWREVNSDIRADLSEAVLLRADLSGFDLREANLISANLSEASLSGANLYHVDLVMANLRQVVFDGADLSWAHLTGANLAGASLRGAHFWFVDLVDADVSGADFGGASLYWSRLGHLDLSLAKGLEEVKHRGPSMLSIDTINLSKGKIPESFLRGCGVPDEFIRYSRSLAGKAIEFYSCFISYSGKDQDFADRLYTDLQNKGVRCWFAPEDLKIGDRFQERIEDSIRVYDKLLIILSEEAISSRWVEGQS